MPATRLACEWWNSSDPLFKTGDCLSQAELVNCFVASAPLVFDIEDQDLLPDQVVVCVENPVSLGLRGFANSGFTRVNPTTFKSVRGHSVNLVEDSPAFINQSLYSGFVSSKVASLVDNVVPRDERFSANPWFDPLGQLYWSKKGLSPRQKRLLLHYCCHKSVTRSVLNSWGYSIGEDCPHCGQCDDAFHRVFLCPFFEDERKAAFGTIFPDGFPEGFESDVMFTRGWIPTPTSIDPPLCATLTPEFEINGEPSVPFQFDHDKDIHFDGSSFNATHPLLHRGGFICMQVDSSGQPVKAIGAPLPSCLPQSAAAAERLAVCVANMFAPSHFCASFVGDCKGALQLVSHNSSARSSSKLWGGVARSMHVDGIKSRSAVWVKAHQCVDSASSLNVLANESCDVGAKRFASANSVHPLQSEDYFSSLRFAKRFLKGIAVMLDLWPGSKEDYGVLVREKSRSSRHKLPGTKHNFKFDSVSESWFCVHCFRRKHKPRSKLDRSPCQRFSSSLAEVVKHNVGHRLFAAYTQSGLPIVFCKVCGYYSSSRAQKLLEPCVGKVCNPLCVIAFNSSPARHPVDGGILDRPVPLALSGTKVHPGPLRRHERFSSELHSVVIAPFASLLPCIMSPVFESDGIAPLLEVQPSSDIRCNMYTYSSSSAFPTETPDFQLLVMFDLLLGRVKPVISELNVWDAISGFKLGQPSHYDYLHFNIGKSACASVCVLPLASVVPQYVYDIRRIGISCSTNSPKIPIPLCTDEVIVRQSVGCQLSSESRITVSPVSDHEAFSFVSDPIGVAFIVDPCRTSVDVPVFSHHAIEIVGDGVGQLPVSSVSVCEIKCRAFPGSSGFCVYPCVSIRVRSIPDCFLGCAVSLDLSQLSCVLLSQSASSGTEPFCAPMVSRFDDPELSDFSCSEPEGFEQDQDFAPNFIPDDFG